MKTIVGIVFFLMLLSCKYDNKTTIVNVDFDSEIKDEKGFENKIDSLLEKHLFLASNSMKMPYRLFTPKNTFNTQKPLLVFLHGRGDRGTDNGAQTYHEAGMITGENSLLSPKMQKKYPCYILVPQCSDITENEEWAKWVGNTPQTPFKGLGEDGSYTIHDKPSASGAAALELIKKLSENKNIDANRIYLIGVSMGGFGTWEFVARQPNLFAAAVPMAGYSDPKQIQRIKHIPFWIFHGEVDQWNPVQGSRTMYNLLTNESSTDVRYTEYKNTGHGEAFKKAFNETNLIPWLFSKHKEVK